MTVAEAAIGSEVATADDGLVTITVSNEEDCNDDDVDEEVATVAGEDKGGVAATEDSGATARDASAACADDDVVATLVDNAGLAAIV